MTFENHPAGSGFKLFESAVRLDEGKEKDWGDGYSSRLDRRPVYHGGDQLHIFGPKRAWAYRLTGARSEPNKYTRAATNKVKDIVSQQFGVSRDIVEARVVSAGDEELLIEVSFR